MYRYGRRRHGYWIALIKLISHVAGTAFMFVAILLASWGLSWLVHRLHEGHPFPDKIYAAVTKIELFLVYFDMALSGAVLLVGAFKFLLELWESWE